MRERERIIYRANPFQKRVAQALATEKSIVAIFAGWRTGKTDFTSIEHVVQRQLYDNPDCLHLIGANTYSQLLDSTLRTVYNKLDWMGIPHLPKDLPRTGRPFSLFLHNGEKWVEFLCRSMDNFDIVAGTTLGSVWLDEVWGTERWTYDLAKSRLSDKNSRHLQLVLTSTKDEPDHWMHTDIVEPYKGNRELSNGSHARDQIEIVEGTTFDNKINLAPGYIETQESTLEKRLFDRFIRNLWVSTATGRAYPYYDFGDHGRVRPFDYSAPFMLCLDFNIDPCLWFIGQDTPGFTYIRDEIFERNTDIWKMCAEAKRRLRIILGERAQQHRIIFYGDYQHGTGRGLSATASSWEIVSNEFRGWNVEFRKKSNPRIVDRVNATNSRMRSADGVIRFAHHPDCVQLRKDYEIVTHEDLRNYQNQGDRTHSCSAVDYMMNYEYGLRPKVSGVQL